MDDVKRAAIYTEVMHATRIERMEAARFERDCGRPITPGEQAELDSRLKEVERLADISTRAALLALDEADDTIRLIDVLHETASRGLAVVPDKRPPNDDEEEEEEDA